jgi:hypothetical protein
MKAITFVTTTMFAVTSAFAPTRVAFNSVATRAFSRSAATMMANPKGKFLLVDGYVGFSLSTVPMI